MTRNSCGTGMAEALSLAWGELKKNPLEGALNLIVLFTDGQPSALTVYANDPADNVMNQPDSRCAYENAASPVPASRQMKGALTIPGSSAPAMYYSDNCSAGYPNCVRGLYRDMQITLNGPLRTSCDGLNSATSPTVLPAARLKGDTSRGPRHARGIAPKSTTPPALPTGP